MTDDQPPTSTDDLESDPAVLSMMQWLRRGAPTVGRPSAETHEAALAAAFRVQDERDRLQQEVAGLQQTLHGIREQEPSAYIRELEITRNTAWQVQDALRQEIAQSRASVDEARAAAAHMWHAAEQGLTQEEVVTWYPWLLLLLDDSARERVEQVQAGREALHRRIADLEAALAASTQAPVKLSRPGRADRCDQRGTSPGQ